MKPTDRRQQIYTAIRTATQHNGYPPTIREIADAIGASHGCVATHLDVMRANGDVDWEDGRGRTLRLLPKAAE
jgi:repressor LexA